MKKIVLLVIMLVLLFIVGYLLLYQPKEKLEIKQPILLEKEYKIKGRIHDATMNQVTIKTEKGSIYTFSLMDVNLKNISGIKLDQIVEITYYGVFDTSKTFQDGTVKDLKIIAQKEDTYPISWNDSGIFKDYYDKAYEKLKNMTLDEKIAQLLVVRVPEKNQVEIVKQYQFGGYILFGRDTKGKTKEEFINNIRSYQEVSKIPLIIATDEEGGIVKRVSTNPNLVSEPFLSSQELYKKGGYNLIEQDTKKKNTLLSSLGINMNLAPVADVSTNKNDYIYNRSFGLPAEQTATYVKTVITASKNSKVSYVLKHFPGYGNNADTHTGMAIDKRSYETFVESDFLPFLSGIKNGAPAILVSHNIVTSIDKDNPASVSKNVHNILREQLEFTGIIMTDDLAMDAILKNVDNAPVKAILSGNDMLIISDYEVGIADIKKGLAEGKITEDMINHMVFRVIAYKYYMEL